ncbi:MAG: Ig-like domain-containing protein [Bacilli bacterium]|nr:Ig-like domain-containing protein [Bacilli bacterium]
MNKKVIIFATISVILIISILTYLKITDTSGNIILTEVDNLVLSENTIYSFKALAYPKKENLKYEIEDKSIATIDKYGNITTLKEGSTKIIVSNKYKSEIVKLQVSNIETSITGIEVDGESINIGVGEKYLIKTTLYPENANMKNLIWSSSDESVLTVDNGYITGVKADIATINIKLELL